MTLDRTTTPATRPALRGAFTALVTPFTRRRRRRRGRPPPARPLAGPRRHRRPRPVRHDRRGADPHARPSATGSSRSRSRPSPSARPAARVPVVAGTGTNDTAATIAATRRAAALGADAALVVAPYYNRPDGRMLEAHFRAVADDGDLPIVVYNVPSRTGTNVPADVVPPPRRASPRHRDQGGERQPRADRPDLPRSAARRRGPRRRRRLDAADARAGRRRRRLGREQRDPGRAGRAVRRGRVPATGTARAGSTSAGCRCSSRTSRGGPNPVPVEGRARADGPARDRRRPAAAPAAGRRRRGPSSLATLRGLGLVEAAGGRMRHPREVPA